MAPIAPEDVDDFDFPLVEASSSSAIPGSSLPHPMASGSVPPNMADLASMFSGMMGGSSGMGMMPQEKREPDRTRWKNWETIYPIYLDAKVPYKTGGRRVSLQYSLRWPLAHHIQQVCSQIGFPAQLENDKTHPSDWQNPGRVKVLIKKGGKPTVRSIKDKYTLLCRLGTLLRPLESKRLNLPPPTIDDRISKPLPLISLRLPYNSPAVSHGVLEAADAHTPDTTTDENPSNESNSKTIESKKTNKASTSTQKPSSKPPGSSKKKKGRK